MKARKIVLASACLVLLVIAIIQAVTSRIDPVKVLTIKETIDEVVIDRPQGELRLKKNAEDWFVGEKQYLANASVCDEIAEAFAEVRLLGKVTKTSDETVLAKYDLNEDKAYKVTVYSEGKALRTFRVGKGSSTNSQVYMMIDGANDVYLASGSVQDDCAKTVSDLRSKTVWSFNKDDISSITIKSADGVYEDDSGIYGEWTMSRGEEGNVYSIAGETVPSDFELSDDKAATWFNGCANLTVVDWLGDYEPIPGTKIIAASMRVGGKTVSLDLYKGQDADGNDAYWGSTSESPYSFKLAKYTVEKYQKNPGDFWK